MNRRSLLKSLAALPFMPQLAAAAPVAPPAEPWVEPPNPCPHATFLDGVTLDTIATIGAVRELLVVDYDRKTIGVKHTRLRITGLTLWQAFHKVNYETDGYRCVPWGTVGFVTTGVFHLFDGWRFTPRLQDLLIECAYTTDADEVYCSWRHLHGDIPMLKCHPMDGLENVTGRTIPKTLAAYGFVEGATIPAQCVYLPAVLRSAVL